jgi:hypothetical protein
MRVSASAGSQSVGVAGALVRGSDGQPKHLHLSVPYVPLWDRRSRAWVRNRISAQAADSSVPVTIHRMTRSGTVTNKKGWLSWL